MTLVLAACGGEDRPAVADWQPAWEAMVARMPTAQELGEPPDRSVCSDALGDMRSTRASLFPTPDAAMEPVVREWVRIAEDALFECPPSSDAVPDLDAAYNELERLEAEVAVVLELDVDDSYTAAVGLGGLGRVYDQDTSNMAAQTRGFRSSLKRGQTLGNYQEVRARHLQHRVRDHVGGS